MPAREIGTYTIYLCRNGKRFKTLPNVAENIPRPTIETRTLNPGAIGNDRPISIVKEFWYSPQLGINLSVKRMDPRHATEIFNVTDLSLAEPDPKYFVVPAGFSTVDHRSKTGERAQAASASAGQKT